MTNDEFLELKKAVINELAAKLDPAEKRSIAKEFSLSEDRLDELLDRLLDKWLSDADLIVMLATLMGLSLPRKKDKRSARYIG